MKLRLFAALAVLIAVPSLHAQQAVEPIKITARGVVSVVYQPDGTVEITITSSGGFIPPTPVDPTPNPVDPPPTPTPTPTPVPAWGPLAKIVVLYEADALTGREPWYYPDFLDVVDGAVGKQGRVYIDRDLEVTRADWADLVARAKAEHKGSADPILYAFDDKGRIKAQPLKDLSPENAAAAVKGLSLGAAK